MVDAGTYNAFNWIDLSTPDVTGATSFYRDLFGWTFEATPTPMGEYFIATVDGHQVGGIMEPGPGQPPMPPMWTTFCFVENVDNTAAVAEEAGGTILEPPFDIPGDSRVAVVADPTGAMLGLISGPRPEGAYLSRIPGAVCWVELLTRDTQAAEGFYTAVFGWKAVTDVSGGTAYTMFQLDDHDVAGMMMMPDKVPAEAPAHWAVYFTTADCLATEKTAAALGGQVLRPTGDIEVGKFAVLADPQGAPFHLMEFAA